MVEQSATKPSRINGHAKILSAERRDKTEQQKELFYTYKQLT